MNKILWDNQERRRYYGLRKGDLVEYKTFGQGGHHQRATVCEYSGSDNNSIYLIRQGEKEPFKYVAEWCTIIKKVEEKDDSNV